MSYDTVTDSQNNLDNSDELLTTAQFDGTFLLFSAF